MASVSVVQTTASHAHTTGAPYTSPTDDDLPLLHTFLTQNRITLRNCTFDDVSSSPAIFELIARRYDTLSDNTRRLRGQICCRIMLFHVGHTLIVLHFNLPYIHV